MFSFPRTVFLALVIGVTFLGIAVAQSDPDSLLQQARRAEKAGDYASAADAYHQALAIAPGNPEVLKRLGVLEQTELKFDDSIAHLRKVLALNSEYPEVNFFLGFRTLDRVIMARPSKASGGNLQLPSPIRVRTTIWHSH